LKKRKKQKANLVKEEPMGKIKGVQEEKRETSRDIEKTA
jgi:hypothetical protein